MLKRIRERWTRAQGKLRKVRLWLVAAVTLAMIVFPYWGYVGASYWLASHQVEDLRVRSRELSATLRSATPGSQSPKGDISAIENRMKGVQEVFFEPASEVIVGALYRDAKAARLDVLIASSGKPVTKVENEVQYRTTNIALTLAGDLNGVADFIQSLRKQLPPFALSDFRVVGLDGQPSVQVQLLLYSSPEQPAKPKAPTAPAGK